MSVFLLRHMVDGGRHRVVVSQYGALARINAHSAILARMIDAQHAMQLFLARQIAGEGAIELSPDRFCLSDIILPQWNIE